MRLLSAIVRLAEGLDRSHAQVVQHLSVGSRGGTLTIRLAPRGDAELELWAAGRHAAALASVLDVPVAFELTGHRRRRPATRRRGAAARPA